jgi:hypothetical protein
VRAHRIRWIAPFVLALAGCVPLTLSSEDAMDFEQYRSVYVAPIDGYYERGALQDLVSELERRSGFERVTVDPYEPTDLELYVHVTFVEEWDDDGVDYSFFTEYVARRTVDAAIVKAGEFETDDSFRDLVDRLVEEFQRGYRI